MNQFLLWLLIGFGAGIVIFPILLGIFILFKNTLERRKIKKMIKKGQFLIPIDTRDYDEKAWEGQIIHNVEDIKNLNKIFEKKIKDPSPDSIYTLDHITVNLEEKDG